MQKLQQCKKFMWQWTHYKPLLGKPAIMALNLVAFIEGIQLQKILDMFPLLFTGLDRLKHKIERRSPTL